MENTEELKKLAEIRKWHSSGDRNKIELCQGNNIWDLEIKKVYKK